MKITIDTDVLNKENISLGEFLVLLMAFYGINYKEINEKVVSKGLISSNLFKDGSDILSNNTRNFVSRLIVESSNEVKSSSIDFYSLAHKMQNLFPDGCKEGTSYPWKSDINDVAFKLMLLVYRFNFKFTEKEALDATEKYIKCFNESNKYMQLLKYFVLKTHKYKNKEEDFTSLFMTMIENNRNNRNNEVSN